MRGLAATLHMRGLAATLHMRGIAATLHMRGIAATSHAQRIFVIVDETPRYEERCETLGQQTAGHDVVRAHLRVYTCIKRCSWVVLLKRWMCVCVCVCVRVRVCICVNIHVYAYALICMWIHMYMRMSYVHVAKFFKRVLPDHINSSTHKQDHKQTFNTTQQSTYSHIDTSQHIRMRTHTHTHTQREREREGERGRDRCTDGRTDTHTHTHTHAYIQRERDTHRHRHAHTHTHTQRERERERERPLAGRVVPLESCASAPPPTGQTWASSGPARRPLWRT